MQEAKGHVRLLHLEDDPRDAALIQDRLEAGELSCEIVQVKSREEYAAALSGGPFDLILTDYNLRGYDGLSALRLARERQPDAPVIVISGSLGEEEAVNCLHVGATDYLLKGRLERLLPAIRRALQEAAELRRLQQAEAELRESEERHRLLFQSNPVPMWVYDVETLRFLAVNRKAVSSYGYSEEEFLAMTIRDIRPPADLHQLHVAVEVMRQGQHTLGTWRHRKKNGEVIDVEVTSDTIVFGGRQARLVLASDITERKQAAEATRALAEQYRAIFEGVTNAILILDLSGRIVTANKAACEMAGYSLQELAGVLGLELVRPSDRPKLEMLAAKAREGEASYAEAVHLRKDGSEVDVVIHSAAFMMRGEPHLLLIMSNVSEQKRLQQQLERTDRISSLGRLAANIAHEMNNVMMGILPFAEIVKRRAAGDPMLENAAAHIAKGIARGRVVTQEILRFTRAAVEPELQPLDARRFLADLTGEIRPGLSAAIALEVSCEDDLFILGDAAQLQQVVTNLVVNARDAMPGGGKIRLKLATSTAAETARFSATAEPESYAHLQVIDSGHGMPPHVLAHIFEPLFTTKQSAGTGLGLAIVQQIVTVHGGFIRVDSEPQTGTTVHVLLRKAVRADASPAPEQADEHLVWQTVRHVVLVEDEPSVGEGIVALLEAEGVQCEWLRTGGEAVARLEAFRPDLLILDVGLPDMSGIEVYRQVAGFHPDLPTLFSTGHGDHRMLGDLPSPETVGFLSKPYDFSSLSQRVLQLLRHGAGPS
jgi:PAS domain S-box-containing protein